MLLCTYTCYILWPNYDILSGYHLQVTESIWNIDHKSKQVLKTAQYSKFNQCELTITRFVSYIMHLVVGIHITQLISSLYIKLDPLPYYKMILFQYHEIFTADRTSSHAETPWCIQPEKISLYFNIIIL